MCAFARRPRWILTHALIGVVVGLCVLAGIWQLDRLGERRERNALVEERRAMPVAGTAEVFDAREEAAHRRVRVTGRYDTGRELVLVGRHNGGSPGNHVLTPLVLSGGRALLVDRGWVPPSEDSAPVHGALPPQRPVDVTGVLLPSEGNAPLGGGGATSSVVSRIDVARIARSLPYETIDLYLLAQEQDPPQPGELPRPVTLAELGEGSHQVYAVQWFLFAVVGVVGYGAILRREARKRPGA